MTLCKSILKRLFTWFAGELAALATTWVRTGKCPPLAAWLKLERRAASLMWWFAFDAAANLLHRAGQPRLVIPKGETLTISDLIRANPQARQLLKNAREQAFNLAKEWRKGEQKQTEMLVSRHRVAPSAEPTKGEVARRRVFQPFDAKLFNKSIDYRVRRFRRDRASRMVAAAEYELLQEPAVRDAFPFAEFLTRDDARVRPTHAVMHGFVALVTHDIWQYICPSCGYNCRCYRILRTRNESIQRGWMTADGKPAFAINWPNETAQANYRRGLPYHDNPDPHAVPTALRRRVFPDPGPFMMSRNTAVSV